MSTIIATTEVPPFQREISDGEEDWGIVKVPDPEPSPAPSVQQSVVEDHVEIKPQSFNEDDVEIIQIPDRPETDRIKESLSDSSSTCSFDVIDENKRKAMLESENYSPSNEEDDDSDEDVDESSDDVVIVNETEFHLDFPTMIALFCLTTVLGFVIGHGKFSLGQFYTGQL